MNNTFTSEEKIARNRAISLIKRLQDIDHDLSPELCEANIQFHMYLTPRDERYIIEDFEIMVERDNTPVGYDYYGF